MVNEKRKAPARAPAPVHTPVPAPAPAHAPAAVFGEFLFTFTFNSGLREPIVQPNTAAMFPTPTVPPVNVKYVEGGVQNPARTGLLVPGGKYLVYWNLNPSRGASVTLRVNGKTPLTVPTGSEKPFPYTQQISVGAPIEAEFYVTAPKRKDNLLSLVNTGKTLFTLSDIPNTRVGNTSTLIHVRVLRVA